MPGSNQTSLPARPLSPAVRVQEIDGDLELSHWPLHWLPGCGFLGFLTAFLVITYLIFDVNPAPAALDLGLLVGLTVVSAVGIGLLIAALGCFFGAERVRLGPGGLDYEARVLVPVRRRRVPLDELKGPRAGFAVSAEHPNRVRYFITFDALGEPIRFARGITETEQSWLVALVNRHLRGLRPPCPSPEADVAPEEGPWVLRPSPAPLRPPSDSLARLRQRPDGVSFVWPDGWDLGQTVGATLVAVGWNALITAFIVGQVQNFTWVGFFVLIPFGLVGLYLLAGWFRTVTAPAWRLTWVFRENEIVRRYSGFGIGWNRRYKLRSNGDPLARIEVHRAEGEEVESIRFLYWFRPPSGMYALYSLALVQPDGKELVRVDCLTEGEARWMADVLFKTFPAWFPVP
ncbi:MAG: hypothetical protein L0Z62_28660 [Gemmataceae bacterium]|nr:hypothetical protein [Gemmataceae bacterium]